MLYLAILALIIIVIALIILRERDARLLEHILTAATIERRSLLDRIQHPERTQVEPVEREPVEPPRDSAELAYIGHVVPDGVQVGTDGSSNE